jgi:hypothetical protein
MLDVFAVTDVQMRLSVGLEVSGLSSFHMPLAAGFHSSALNVPWWAHLQRQAAAAAAAAPAGGSG